MSPACNQPADIPVKNPYPSATEVRLFVEQAYSGDGEVVFSKPGGRILKANERSELESALYVTKMPDLMAACFVPHHFFRYYDARGKQVGEIEVCFCCAGVSVSENANVSIGPNQILDADYGKVEDLVRRLGEPTDVNCD